MENLKIIIKMIILQLLIFLLNILVTINGTNDTNANSINNNNNDEILYIKNELSKKNNELNEKNKLVSNFIDNIYFIFMDKKINVNNMPVDSIIKHINEFYNLFPTNLPIKETNKIKISSKFGWRINPVTHKKHFHKGIDISAPLNTKIYATMSGKVIFVRKNCNSNKLDYGNYIIIKNSIGFKTLYSHLNKIYVNENDIITKGQLIGTVGNSGRTTGSNIHYEIQQSEELKNPLDSIFMNNIFDN